MSTFPRIQDLLIWAKLILPYSSYRNTLLDTISEDITSALGEIVLNTVGISVIRAAKQDQGKDKTYIIDLSCNYIAGPEYSKDSFYYFNNPDGSMRWVWPTHLRYPTFLQFYTPTTWKSKCWVFAIEKAFQMGLQKWICSGMFHLYSKERPNLKRYLRPKQAENFSIFMGTVGPNRKVIMELNDGRATTHFVKMALSNASSLLLKNEFSQLDTLGDYSLSYIKTPYSFLFHDERALVQPSMAGPSCERTIQWTKAHTLAKLEMEEKTMTTTVLTKDYLIGQGIKVKGVLQKTNLPVSLLRLALKIEKICASYSRRTGPLPLSFCHNDFTPWNMYVEGDILNVYDWELAGNSPVLTDLFHYHMQKGVMVEHLSYAEIRREIFGTLETPEWKAFVKRHHLDVAMQFSMYLIQVATYYLDVYSRQPSLHWQAEKMIAVWDLALEESLAWQKSSTFRQQFIDLFFKELNSKSYAFLKFIYGSVKQLPESSDLDILIAKQDLPSTLEFIKRSSLVAKIKINHKSFMSTVHLFFLDGSFLSLDLITSFKRTQNIMMSAAEVLEERRMVNSLYLPNPKHHFEYVLLFYQLNRSAIPERYCLYFNGLSDKEKKDIEHYITNKYFLGYKHLSDLYDFDQNLLVALNREIVLSDQNLGLYSIKNNFLYLKDSLLGMWQNRGFVLTFSGVDGAGKSTVIAEIKHLLESKYRQKVHVLRHRPSVLPILSAWVHGKEKAEKRTMEQLPRSGANQSTLKSLFRFGYYLSDYLIGQLYVYIRFVLRGKVVIYDRYYFDFISDSKRSNIVLPSFVAKAFYPLIYKPEINVFLYAPAAEILKRKQELLEKDINELTDSYKNLFKDLSTRDRKHGYMSIQNMNLRETLREIESQITKIS